jgi:HPr kinase/phosphorylase
MTAAGMLLHGSCVALSETGVLLLAPPGGGKSDLALRLIGRGARLVADDQVRLSAEGGALRAAPPEALEGRIELRGLGLMAGLPWAPARLGLVVDLVPPGAVARLPEPARWEALGVALPRLALDPRAPSAPDLVMAAVAALEGRWRCTAGALAA